MEFVEICHEVFVCKDCTKESDSTFTCCKRHSKVVCKSFLDLSKSMLEPTHLSNS